MAMARRPDRPFDNREPPGASGSLESVAAGDFHAARCAAAVSEVTAAMRLTFMQQLQSVFGALSPGYAGAAVERPDPICLQRARLALSQLQAVPECLLVAERIQHARRLL